MRAVLHPNAGVQARAKRRAEVYFRASNGRVAWARRAAEIAALPAVAWRGETLRTVRCNGDFGRGPHDVNLPGHVLWALYNLRGFLCAFHR